MLEARYDPALAVAAQAALEWLDGLDRRPVRPERDARAMLAAFAGPLPERGCDPAEVVRDLASRAEPGLMATGSGRFNGWVIGGAMPAPIAADWLVSAWDRTAPWPSPSRRPR